MNIVDEAKKYHLIFHHRTCEFLDEGFIGRAIIAGLTQHLVRDCYARLL
jgi:hypothetical protein